MLWTAKAKANPSAKAKVNANPNPRAWRPWQAWSGVSIVVSLSALILLIFPISLLGHLAVLAVLSKIQVAKFWWVLRLVPAVKSPNKLRSRLTCASKLMYKALIWINFVYKEILSFPHYILGVEHVCAAVWKRKGTRWTFGWLLGIFPQLFILHMLACISWHGMAYPLVASRRQSWLLSHAVHERGWNIWSFLECRQMFILGEIIKLWVFLLFKRTVRTVLSYVVKTTVWHGMQRWALLQI